MLAPRLYDIPAFDATKQFEISFRWSGDQAMGSKLTVKDNDTNAVVYEGTTITMRQVFVLPANSLTNGKTYNAVIEILDKDQAVISDKSESRIFKCLSTPVFTFSGLVDGQQVDSSTLVVTLSYSQAEQEIMSQYQLLLYDVNRTVIKTFETRYLTSYITEVSQAIQALENDTNYYVRATGQTKNGISLDTGLYRINVRYTTPALFSKLDLFNDRKNGNISITSNLVQVEGVADPEAIYIHDKMVDVRNGTVTFSDGFRFGDSWAVGAILCGLKQNVPLITWKDGDYNINLYYRECVFDINNGVNKGYFELLIPGPLGNKIIGSNFLPPITGPESMRTIWIIKNEDYYELRAFEQSDAEL